MDRRDFLKTVAVGAAAAAVSGQVSGRAAEPAPAAGAPDVAIVRGNDPVAMFRKGIEAIGGMKAYVKPGQSVLLKPNCAWDRKAEDAANTNPELVGEIVRQALAAGAARVEVFDHTCSGDWKAVYKNSGIEDAVLAAGGIMLPGNEAADYEEVERPEALVMKKAKIHKALLAADVFINAPVLKNHGGTKLTAVMKNFMGIVWDRRFMHNNNLPQSIADAYLYRRPALNVVDAYRVMARRGPSGGQGEDIVQMGYQLLGVDPVVLDTLSAQLLRYPLEEVTYLALAENMGLGVGDPAKHTLARLEA